MIILYFHTYIYCEAVALIQCTRVSPGVFYTLQDQNKVIDHVISRSAPNAHRIRSRNTAQTTEGQDTVGLGDRGRRRG